jgi:hypothetical protein
MKASAVLFIIGALLFAISLLPPVSQHPVQAVAGLLTAVAGYLLTAGL